MLTNSQLYHNKLCIFAAFNFVIVLFWSMSPYIRWLVPSELALFLLLASTMISTLSLKQYVPECLCLNETKKIILVSIICFVIYFTTPLVHTMRWGHFIYFLIFMFIVPLNNLIIFKGCTYLRKLFIFLSIVALLYWILNYFKIPLLYYTYILEDRGLNSGDNYRIYGLALSLYRGSAPIGGGLERICSVFGEPGHYAIYISFILAIDKFRFNRVGNLILFTIGCLTFSTAYYGLMTMGIMYRIVLEKGVGKGVKNVLLIIIGLLFLVIIFGGNNFFYTASNRIFEDREVDNIVDLVENRASNETKEIYSDFLNSGKLLIGNGYDERPLQITNWRGFIYQFGVIGVLITLFLILSIIKKVDLLYFTLLLSMILLVALHRSYQMYSITFYLLAFTAVCVNTVERKYIIYKNDSINVTKNSLQIE